MDPDKNLEEQLSLAQTILSSEWEDIEESRDEVYRLAELVESLDEWMKKGGFLPSQWQVTKVEGK